MSDLTLDELFAAAKKEYAKVLAAKPVKEAPTPTRWVRGLNIRLLHSGTDAFLGDFSEWLSGKDGARKLVREEDNSLPIHKIERIAGDWGTNAPLAADCPKKGYQYLVELEVLLEETVPLCGRAGMLVSFTGEVVEAACTVDEYSFAGGGQILELPFNFNLYPLLTRASKIALFTEVRRMFSQEP